MVPCTSLKGLALSPGLVISRDLLEKRTTCTKEIPMPGNVQFRSDY